MTRKLSFFFLALRHSFHFNQRAPFIKIPHRFLALCPNITRAVNVYEGSRLTHRFIDNSIAGTFVCASFGSHRESHSDSEREFDTDPDNESTYIDFRSPEEQWSSRDLETIEEIIRTGTGQEKCKKLEQCGVSPTPPLVGEVLSRTRNDWETAFTFFIWAGKQSGYNHSRREYHSMISILGKFRRFDTAWSLVDEMRAASLVSPMTILIMIRKYAAVHDVAKAINAFYALKRFKFEVGMDEFQGLLSALSRYKNVKDAEHLLFCNKTVFPLTTKSFNIILNGWCNVMGDMREGKRIWREMETRGIKHDVYSYSSLMSCYSKAANLNSVLRLFDKMKAVGIEPDRKVYNAVIHALAKGRLVKEARGIMKTMEEGGFIPNAVTYNSLIVPICRAQLFDEANDMLNEMLETGIIPTVRTYHALFRMLRTGEEVFELLNKMLKTGCPPCHETYIMLIRKFCRWRQLDNVFKLWNGMSRSGLDPDRSSYIVLIHGLFLNGKLEEAQKYYMEMKEKDLLPEPKTDEMLQAWLAGKMDLGQHLIDIEDSKLTGCKLGQKARVESRKSRTNKDFRHQPELRNVIRERGFSFWDS